MAVTKKHPQRCIRCVNAELKRHDVWCKVKEKVVQPNEVCPQYVDSLNRK